MHRSLSTTRASDEFHLGIGTPESNCTGGQGALLDYSSTHLMLPKYDPQSEYSAKKEATGRPPRASSGAIHLIPLVLITCAVVLWFFSSPRVGVITIKADSVVIAGVDNTTVQRRLNNGTDIMKMPLGLEAGGAVITAASGDSSSRGHQ